MKRVNRREAQVRESSGEGKGEDRERGRERGRDNYGKKGVTE